MKIRDQEINLEIFKENIEFFKTQNWSFEKWEPKPAIRDKSGSTSKYVGQKYNSEEWDFLEKGWNHDHCEICSIRLSESEYAIEQFGYVNESEDWICHECFGKLIKENFKENEFVLKYKLNSNNERSYLFISPMMDKYKFEITENTFFGESKLEKYLDISRNILKNGEQDYQTFAIILKDRDEIKNFEEHKLYELADKSKES